MEFDFIDGTRLTLSVSDGPKLVDEWKSGDGGPVPVLVASRVWVHLVEAAGQPVAEGSRAAVFRLFMIRGEARHVVELSPITETWLAPYGITRWKEGGYPSRVERLRKGGNAFLRSDANLKLSDVWWMAREQTDLRIILAPIGPGRASLGAWWVRGSDNQKVKGLAAGRFDTQGTPLPVHLLVEA